MEIFEKMKKKKEKMTTMPRLIDANKLERKAKFNQQVGNFIELSDLKKAPTIDTELKEKNDLAKRYVIMVTPEASFSTVLPKGYETIEEATQFILNKKHSYIEKVNEFEYDTTNENEDYVRYNIVEVTI